jgi:hypothetical protein
MLLIIFGMVVVPGLIVYFAMSLQGFTKPNITVGDLIVYRKQKASTRPGKRAYDIRASEQGDLYTYLVDKYWTVADILGDDHLVAVTRTNKRHYLTPDDPNLRKARLTERLLYGHRFPHLTESHA